ncbi:hypothetical protein B0H14DRAFT_3489189 [Mycena olivaceomarginata]|nr:hypothetical protein B0H14DRAFT_3489189 [Mycena olivaceomarginata]
MADTTVAGSKALHRDFFAKVPPGMQTPKFPSTLPRKHYHASALTPRASPDNPFLASPLDPESAALMNKPDRLGVLEEKPTTAFVFCVLLPSLLHSALVPNPHYRAVPNPDSELPPEHPDFEPDERCVRRLIFERGKDSMVRKKGGSKSHRI